MKKLSLPFLALLVFYAISDLRAAEQDSITILKNLLKTPIENDQRVRNLSRLCAIYWNTDPDSSLWFGWQGLALVNKKVRPVTNGKLHFSLGMAWENKGDVDSAFWYLKRASDLYLQAGELRLHYRAVEQIGSLYRIIGRYDTAIVLMNSALEYFRKTGNNFQVMSTLFNIGSVYLEQNRYNKALEYYLASAAYDSVLNEPDAKATHLLGIGTLYLNMANLHRFYKPEKSSQFLAMACQNFLECHQLFRTLNHRTGVCFTSMSLLSLYIERGEIASADSILVADSACLSFTDPRVLTGYAFSEARLLVKHGKKQEAMNKLARLYHSRDQMMVIPEFHDGMLLFGSLLRENNLNDSAQHMVEQSFEWARKNSVYPIAMDALSMLSEWSLAGNHTAAAIAYLRQATIYKDSLFLVIGNEIFDETEIKYRSRLLKAELDQLRSENLMQRFRLRGFILASILTLLFLSMLVVLFNWKRKKAKALQKLAELRADVECKEKVVKEKDIENLRLEMQIKEQELVFHTLLGLDLSKLTKSISAKLEPFQIRFSKKREQEDFAQVLSEIKRDSEKDPMNNFEVLFRQMHGNYYEKLLKICPDLTRSELQLCALLRLNLSTKDIARIIHLTVASIDVTRSKIRKKLGLDQGQSLTSYLIALG